MLVSMVTKIKILTINNIKQILSDVASISRTEPYSLLLTSPFSSHICVKLINAIWQTEGKFFHSQQALHSPRQRQVVWPVNKEGRLLKESRVPEVVLTSYSDESKCDIVTVEEGKDVNKF